MGLRMDLIPKKGIRIESQHDILLNMSKESVLKMLGEPQDISRSQFFYPGNIVENRERFYYTNIWIAIDFLNDKIESFETGKNEEFYFNNINLSKEDFKTTIAELKQLEYTAIVNDDTYKFDSLNFFIYAPNNGDSGEELESLGIYTDGCFEKMNRETEEYDTTSKTENGIWKVFHTLKK